MALFVHTNQWYIKYSETNARRNRIWVIIPRMTRSIPGQPWLQLLSSPIPLCSSSRRSKNLLSSSPKKILRILFCVLFHPEQFPHSLFLFSPIYITPQDLNFFPKRKILLQNLPRRVPLSLNSNGKFPCKKHEILEVKSLNE